MTPPLLARARDFSLSALVAAFVAVLVGFGGTVVLIVQAGQAAGLSPAQIGSWVGSISLAIGVGGMFLSLRYRAPVVLAWSTPGAALLATSLVGLPFGEAVGAFVLAGVLVMLCGLMGWVEPIVRRIPAELAAAMLAGVLIRFGLDVFTSMGEQGWLVLAMCAAYLGGRRLLPRYAMLAVLGVGLTAAWARGLLDLGALQWGLTDFVWTTPVFTLQSAIGLGIPLFVVAMASQNLPGLAVLQASGYTLPASPLMTITGLVSVLSAPFGAHGTTLAAITAAICTGREAHPDPAKRYVAGVLYAVMYLALGLVGAAVAGFFQALPHALVAAVAGLALFGAIMGGLAGAMSNAERREPALITLLATASGATFFGVGSAFWGLVGGLVAYAVLVPRQAPTPPSR